MNYQEKYYTPDISEFHVGFECEFKNNMQDNVWKPEVCDVDTLGIVFDSIEHEDIDNRFADNFRVKYLNKEDIESCGWTFKQDDSYELQRKQHSEHNIDCFSLIMVKNFVFIKYWTTSTHGLHEEILFQGKLKNKSELKKIMKQIGIK